MGGCAPLLISALLHSNSGVRGGARSRLEALSGRSFTRQSTLREKHPRVQEALGLLESGIEGKDEAMLRRALELFKSLPETDVEELARLSELLAEKFALEYQEWLYWFEPKARR